MKIISFIERRQQDVIERILRHCGLWEGPLRTPGPSSRTAGTCRARPGRTAGAAIGPRSGVPVGHREREAVSAVPDFSATWLLEIDHFANRDSADRYYCVPARSRRMAASEHAYRQKRLHGNVGHTENPHLRQNSGTRVLNFATHRDPRGVQQFSRHRPGAVTAGYKARYGLPNRESRAGKNDAEGPPCREKAARTGGSCSQMATTGD